MFQTHVIVCREQSTLLFLFKLGGMCDFTWVVAYFKCKTFFCSFSANAVVLYFPTNQGKSLLKSSVSHRRYSASFQPSFHLSFAFERRLGEQLVIF